VGAALGRPAAHKEAPGPRQPELSLSLSAELCAESPTKSSRHICADTHIKLLIEKFENDLKKDKSHSTGPPAVCRGPPLPLWDTTAAGRDEEASATVRISWLRHRRSPPAPPRSWGRKRRPEAPDLLAPSPPWPTSRSWGGMRRPPPPFGSPRSAAVEVHLRDPGAGDGRRGRRYRISSLRRRQVPPAPDLLTPAAVEVVVSTLGSTKLEVASGTEL
jgi:hypothetical protein